MGDVGFSNIEYSSQFYLSTTNDEYIILQWIYFKVHVHITPVLINLKNRTFRLIDTTRLLYPLRIRKEEEGNIYLDIRETIWSGAKSDDENLILSVETEFMRPIQEFYDLKEEWLPSPIFKWHGKDKPEITIE